MKMKEKLSSILWEVYLHFLGIFVMLIMIVNLITFIPALIFRPIVRALSHLLKPEFGDVVSCIGSVFSQTDDDGHKSKSVIIMQGTFNGNILLIIICFINFKKIIDYFNILKIKVKKRLYFVFY